MAAANVIVTGAVSYQKSLCFDNKWFSMKVLTL